MVLLMVLLFGGASYGQETVTDELTFASLDFSSGTSNYKDFTATGKSGVSYVGNSLSTASNVIQINKTPSGIVAKTSIGNIKSIVVSLNKTGSNNLQFYAKNSSYSSSSELYSTSTQGTLVASVTTNQQELVVTPEDKYKYFGIRTEKNVCYISKISIVWELDEISTTPSLFTTESSLDFSSLEYNTKKELTFNLSGSNLTTDANLSISGENASMFTVTPTTISQSEGVISETPVAVTYAPTEVGTHTATLTISSDGADSKMVTLTGTATAPAVHHTVSWMVNGQAYTVGTPTTDVVEGEKVTLLPTAPDAIDDKVFVGWTDAPLASSQDEKPSVLFASAANAPVVASDVTYYAVFATRTQTGEAGESLAQTLQYDTWTYNGTTTDKNKYRLFGKDSYIESEEFDLGTLSKVIVYGGTFGSGDNKNLTIGDGVNIWKSVTVSGNKEGGENLYTDGESLTGFGKLKIISNSGDASANGVRISKVEIYTVSDGYAYSDYSTSVVKRTLVSIAISGTPTKLTYEAGESFNPEGLVVTGTYDNETSEVISKGISWTVTPETLTVGTTSCTVKATVGDVESEEYVVSGLTVSAAKTTPTISFEEVPANLVVGDEDMFQVNYNGDGKLSVAPSVDGIVDVTIDDDNIVYVKAKSAGTVTITVSASETDEYKTATNSCTLNVVYNGIADIRSQITSISASKKQEIAATKLSNAVVTYIGSASTPTIYVEDENAGVVIYTKDTGLEVGDVINGIISGEGFIYQGLTELTTVDLSQATITKDGEIPCHEVTVAELNENMEKWESRRVKITDLAISEAMNNRNAVVAQNDDMLNVYEKVSGCTGDALSDTNTKIVSLVGYPQDHTVNSATTNQICVWDKSDIITTEYATISIASACTDGSLCYGTYSSSKPFYVSDDIEVSEISVIDGELLVEKYQEGDIVPANTGVMVAALEGGDYKVQIATASEAESAKSVLGEENSLKPTGDNGVTAEDMASANSNCVFYRLTMHNGTNIGYWWGAADGAAFGVAANKAYLAVPKDVQLAAKSGLWTSGCVTGIYNIVIGKSSDVIYNLNGQRIQKPVSGQLYIKNGKTFIAK